MADRIDDIIDRAGIEADLDAVKDSVADLVALIKSVKGTSIGISGAKTAKEYADLRKELDLQIKATKLATTAAVGEAKARTEVAKAVKAETVAKRDETKATQDSAKAKLAEQKLLDQAIDDYYQLSRAYTEAALRAKNLQLRLGEGHPVAVEAAKDANDLGNVLKKLDASVGQNQRNVGNYASAFNGLGFSFTQVARELPSLAINFQTFALAISNNLPMVADEISKARREIAALKAEGKEVPTLGKRLKDAMFSPQVGLSLLITGFTLFAGKLFGASDASKEMAKSTEKLTNAINDQNDALKNVEKNIGTNTKIVLEGLRERDATSKEVFKAELQGELDLLNVKKQNSEASKKLLADEVIRFKEASELRALIGKGFTKKEQDELKKRYDVLKKNIDDSEQAVTDQQDAIILLRAKNRADEADDARDRAKDNKEDAEARARAAKEAFDLRLQTLAELQKIELQQIVDFNREVGEDESLNAYQRIAALRRAKEIEKQIILVDSETEIQLGKKTALEIQLIQEQAADKLLRIEMKFDQDRVDIKKESAEKIKAEEIKLQKDLEDVITNSFNAFEKKRTDDIKKAASERLQILRDAADQERDLYHGLYNDLTSTITAFFDAADEKRIADLDKEIAAINDRRARDIEFINQTVTNRADAADQIAIIDIQANAEKQRIADQQTSIKRRQANIDRLAQIAVIAGDLASGIFDLNAKAASARATAAVLAATPATAAFAPNALLQAGIIQAQIPFLLGQSALRLAALALPRFAEGGEHSGGPMIVGDGGRAEGIELPDGRVLRSPDTPTLMTAPAGTVIHKDFNKMMAAGLSVPGLSHGRSADTSTPQIVGGLGRVEKAIKKQRPQVVRINNPISVKIRK